MVPNLILPPHRRTLTIIVLVVLLSSCTIWPQQEVRPLPAPATWPEQLAMVRDHAATIHPDAVLTTISAQPTARHAPLAPLEYVFEFRTSSGAHFALHLEHRPDGYVLTNRGWGGPGEPFPPAVYARLKQDEAQALADLRLSPIEALQKTLPDGRSFGPEWTGVLPSIGLVISPAIVWNESRDGRSHTDWMVLWNGHHRGSEQRKAHSFVVDTMDGTILENRIVE